MTIAEARLYVTQFARNADEYTATELDRAILAIGKDFVNRTRCTRQLSTVALILNQRDFVTADLPTDFRPDRLIRAYIGTKPELDVADYSEVMALHNLGAITGLPAKIGFDSFSSGSVYPTCDAAYSLKLNWSPPFTVYTPGTATTSTQLNIPDDLIIPVMMYGAVSRLQHFMPEHQSFIATAREEYEMHVRRTKGALATQGAQTASRSRIA